MNLYTIFVLSVCQSFKYPIVSFILIFSTDLVISCLSICLFVSSTLSLSVCLLSVSFFIYDPFSFLVFWKSTQIVYPSVRILHNASLFLIRFPTYILGEDAKGQDIETELANFQLVLHFLK